VIALSWIPFSRRLAAPPQSTLRSELQSAVRSEVQSAVRSELQSASSERAQQQQLGAERVADDVLARVTRLEAHLEQRLTEVLR
jgi:hypothetical protein